MDEYHSHQIKTSISSKLEAFLFISVCSLLAVPSEATQRFSRRVLCPLDPPPRRTIRSHEMSEVPLRISTAWSFEARKIFGHVMLELVCAGAYYRGEHIVCF